MNQTKNSNPLLERCQDEVFRRLGPMLDRCVETTGNALLEAEQNSRSVSGRLRLREAHDTLNRVAAALHGLYPELVSKGIDEALHMDPEQTVPGGVDTDIVLALVDDSEVSRFVEASRLQQSTMPVVAKILSRLDSLVSSALGLLMVRVELNPFRPQIFCDALVASLEAQDAPAEVLNDWLRHIAIPFARELATLYRDLVSLLEDEGVTEARYRLKLSAPGAPGFVDGSAASEFAESGLVGAGHDGSHGAHAGGAGFSGGGAAPGAGGGGGVGGKAMPAGSSTAYLPPLEQLSGLRTKLPYQVIRNFLYGAHYAPEYDQPLTTAFHRAVGEEIQGLEDGPESVWDSSAWRRLDEERQQLSVVERPSVAVRVDQALPPGRWGELASAQTRARVLMKLKAQAEKINQVLGLEAVRALIQQVAEDERLLAPVRRSFVALEPALLRVAIEDPQFFGRENHPARVFIEAVAQRSFRYNDEYADEFENFIDPVRLAVQDLAGRESVESDDFEQHRLRLERDWEQQDLDEVKARQDAMQSLEFAQERQALADRIAWEFSQRSDLPGVPVRIADFIFQDWSLVIAHAQLTNPVGQVDPGGYLAVVSDLLWSTNPEKTLADPARLFEIVPNLVNKLRSGLQVLGKTEEETAPFFDALMRYHRPVLRLRRARTAVDQRERQGFVDTAEMEEEFSDAYDTQMFMSLDAEDLHQAEQPWLAQQEREAAGFDDIGEADVAEESAGESILADDMEDPGHSADSMIGTDLSTLETQSASDSPELARARQMRRARRVAAYLRQGVWVDILVDEAWRRAQLVWISDNESLLMFAGDGGMAYSMTRRRCIKLIMEEALRPIDKDGVIEQALHELEKRDARMSAQDFLAEERAVSMQSEIEGGERPPSAPERENLRP